MWDTHMFMVCTSKQRRQHQQYQAQKCHRNEYEWRMPGPFHSNITPVLRGIHTRFYPTWLVCIQLIWPDVCAKRRCPSRGRRLLRRPVVQISCTESQNLVFIDLSIKYRVENCSRTSSFSLDARSQSDKNEAFAVVGSLCPLHPRTHSPRSSSGCAAAPESRSPIDVRRPSRLSPMPLGMASNVWQRKFFVRLNFIYCFYPFGYLLSH